MCDAWHQRPTLGPTRQVHEWGQEWRIGPALFRGWSTPPATATTTSGGGRSATCLSAHVTVVALFFERSHSIGSASAVLSSSGVSDGHNVCTIKEVGIWKYTETHKHNERTRNQKHAHSALSWSTATAGTQVKNLRLSCCSGSWDGTAQRGPLSAIDIHPWYGVDRGRLGSLCFRRGASWRRSHQSRAWSFTEWSRERLCGCMQFYCVWNAGPLGRVHHWGELKVLHCWWSR